MGSAVIRLQFDERKKAFALWNLERSKGTGNDMLRGKNFRSCLYSKLPAHRISLPVKLLGYC